MNELTINVNLDNLSAENKKIFMELIAEAKAKPNTVWKPDYKDEVWYISPTDCKAYCFYWDDDDADKALYVQGQVFRTKEEAEEEITRRKILKRWKDLSVKSGENNNPWDGKSFHYQVVWNYDMSDVHIATVLRIRNNSSYFPTRNALIDAMREIGKENIKKYILNIKE